MPTHLRFPTRLLALALLLGICADQLFVNHWLGLSVPVFVAAGLITLIVFARAEKRPPTLANLWLMFAALLFATLLAVRDAPMLVVLNVAAVCGLLLLIVAHFRSRPLLQTSFVHATVKTLTAGLLVIAAPFALVEQSFRALPLGRVRLGAAMPVARGLALAAPALLVFGGLLMAADGVFASYVLQTLRFSLPVDWESLISHSLVVGFFAWSCAGGIGAALQTHAANALPAVGDTQRLQAEGTSWRFLGWIEAITILGAIDLLFGTFMLVQGAYFFGGSDTLARTQMTYSDYARRGFFELVAVACLALMLLWALALFGKREPGQQRRVFNTASVAMVALVLGMLISAFQRMWLYEEAYGFSQLRLYTHSFMLWLAAILLLFVLALLRERPQVFSWGIVVASLVYLAALNIANPDALIVRANIARYAETGQLDAFYLTTLSADATPEIAAALDGVDQQSREILQAELKEQHLVLAQAATKQGWPAWSFARAQALAAK